MKDTLIPKYPKSINRSLSNMAFTRMRRNRNIYNTNTAIGRAIRLARNRSMTRTMTQRKRTSGYGVTSQHDSKLIYRKKSMPRYKKRRWRAFKSKVNAVAEKEMGSRTVVFNKSLTFSNTTSGNQVVASVYLYGQASTSSHASDLSNISALENAGNPTAAAGITVDPSTKYLFQSGVLDITVRNATTRDTGTVFDSAAKMEVDIYECTMRTGAEESGTVLQTIEQAFGDNKTRTPGLNGAGAEIDYTLRGVTPFDLTYVLSRWGIKIWKKTKFQVPNGETFSYQIRDPKRHTMTQRDLSAKDGFNRPGVTRVLFITAKVAPGLTVGAGAGVYQESIIIGCTRKYLYKIEGANEDRTAYQQNT